MTRLVYYSLVASNSRKLPFCAWQLQTSIRSLRKHNPEIDIFVFVFGRIPTELRDALAKLRACVVPLGDAVDRCARYLPKQAEILGLSTALPKWLCLSELLSTFGPGGGPEQVLYLDSDTFFLSDVDGLFATDCDLMAREEPLSRRRDLGYRPDYLDEEALAALTSSEGLHFVEPFNTGVVLLNRKCWETLAGLGDVFLSNAWRLLVGLALYDCGPGFEWICSPGRLVNRLRRESGRLISEEDRRRAIPFPCRNPRLVETVSTWLTIGKIDRVVAGRFLKKQVLQGGEWRRWGPGQPVACHYFGTSHAFHKWLCGPIRRGQPQLPGPPPQYLSIDYWSARLPFLNRIPLARKTGRWVHERLLR